MPGGAAGTSLGLDLYREFVAAFRRGAEKLKSGDRDTTFPLGSFPPALPFVGG